MRSGHGKIQKKWPGGFRFCLYIINCLISEIAVSTLLKSKSGTQDPAARMRRLHNLSWFLDSVRFLLCCAYSGAVMCHSAGNNKAPYRGRPENVRIVKSMTAWAICGWLGKNQYCPDPYPLPYAPCGPFTGIFKTESCRALQPNSVPNAICQSLQY